jgi:uncharacterized protein
MDLVDVKVERTTGSPVVVLRPKDGTARVVPIFIGRAEAEAIRWGMARKRPSRPMTHDLAVDLVTACGGELVQVVITQLHENTFHAELHLLAEGRRITVSSRSSDAIALAVRVGVPIYANESVVEEASVGVDDDSDDGAALPVGGDELVVEFRKFIDEIKPEDFG